MDKGKKGVWNRLHVHVYDLGRVCGAYLHYCEELFTVFQNILKFIVVHVREDCIGKEISGGREGGRFGRGREGGCERQEEGGGRKKRERLKE